MSQVEVSSVVKKDSNGLIYLSCLVESAILSFYSAKLKNILSEKYLRYYESKKKRDGNEYHITVINPYELENIDTANLEALEGQKFTIELLGLGKVSRGCDQAYFVVVDSLDIQELRISLGFVSSDLHITLGFCENDIHGVKKDKSTLVVS